MLGAGIAVYWLFMFFCHIPASSNEVQERYITYGKVSTLPYYSLELVVCVASLSKMRRGGEDAM